MPKVNPFIKIQNELQKAINLQKCRRCGCMKETLENENPPLNPGGKFTNPS
jgi:hypothetical protein